VHQPTSYFILCLSLILSLSSGSLLSLLSLSYLLQAYDFLSSQVLLSRLFFTSFLHSLSLCSWPKAHEGARVIEEEVGEEALGLRQSRACTARPRRSRGGLLWLSAHAAYHPLHSYAVWRSSEPCHDASLTQWKSPGLGLGLDTAGVGTSMARHRHGYDMMTTRLWLPHHVG
jgi:hypothetical protein